MWLEQVGKTKQQLNNKKNNSIHKPSIQSINCSHDENNSTQNSSHTCSESTLCLLCKKPVDDSLETISVGMRGVHDLQKFLPYHPNKQYLLEQEERLSYSEFLHSLSQKKLYVHLDCYSPYTVRPYQIMFETSLLNDQNPDEEWMGEFSNVLYKRISRMQQLYRKVNGKKRSKQKEEDEHAEEEEDEDDENSSHKKVKVDSLQKTYVKKKSPRKSGSKDSQASQSASSSSLDTSQSLQWVQSLRDSMESFSSPYLFGLSDEIWNEILSYLTFPKLLSLNKVSKCFYYYSTQSTLWKEQCIQALCPNAIQVQEQYFPHWSNDFKKVFQLLYGNCCIICGEYMRLDEQLYQSTSLSASMGSILVSKYPLYYNHLLDGCVCTACSGSSLAENITKTNAKKKYSVNDEDLNLIRCLRSPNPWHPSTAMCVYSDLQLQVLQSRKNEEAIIENCHKSKNHSKQNLFQLIRNARNGKYGKNCKLYAYLTSNKANAKTAFRDIFAYIDTLEI
ncbi:hypothetical protein C9374_011185 [Naegleria lovaniensis]|uniref:F-box domain-containing protein n=1 Tax=Naegleria lovaniensis TaxID=51637 RepID=A0AA88KFI7_NAELO|nr:uncharacterized protein C9374_011185 [Naegleria lovaniensis]KAG2374106.1 hypothetical protein C9374_011185 [Naegleria lovaniensis]